MSTVLRDLVSALPEVYQPIYGQDAWDNVASRNCNERLVVLKELYHLLSASLGRPLRVLDLGCAQGFFSLNFASLGATVQGIDFLPENIAVCNALAQSNKELQVQFNVDKIEDVIERLQPGDYDLVIGLSVFHHVVHNHGVAKVKSWIKRLTDCVQMVLMEVALKEEPLYWGPSQPSDPRELFEYCSFVHQVTRFNTHLSHIRRPLFAISNFQIMLTNFCRPFNQWSVRPYQAAASDREGSRRYFFGEDYVCKMYQYSLPEKELSTTIRELNFKELHQECRFLESPPPGYTAPYIITSGENDQEGWLVMQRFPGELLSDKLHAGKAIDVDTILLQTLEQLVVLEKAGLYHNDVRTWNVLADEGDNINLIDFGSISVSRDDCVWPINLFQSFFIFVNEIVLQAEIRPGIVRPVVLSPFHLPEPYLNWLYAFWKTPVSQWSYALLLNLFQQKADLPVPALTALDLWVSAQESILMLTQSRLMDAEAQLQQLRKTEFMGEADLNLSDSDVLTMDQMTQVIEAQIKKNSSLQAKKYADMEARIHLLEKELIIAQQQKFKARWGHYLILQKNLLQQQGIKGRTKQLIKRVLRPGWVLIHRKPKLRRVIKRCLKSMGLEALAAKQLIRFNQALQHHNANLSLSDLEKQARGSNLLPEEVKKIFNQLTSKK